MAAFESCGFRLSSVFGWKGNLDRGRTPLLEGKEWDTNVRVDGFPRDFVVWSPKAHLSKESKIECVVEVKVIAGEHQPKVLTGSVDGLDWVLDRAGGLMTDTDQFAGWSLLKDFHRLRELESACEKLLVLVIDNRPVDTEKTKLGHALEHIQFSRDIQGPEIASGIWARIWRVP